MGLGVGLGGPVGAVGAGHEFFPQAGRLVGGDRCAADLFVEQAGDRQGLVADEFGGEADARPAREETVIRVFSVKLGRDVGGSAVGGAGDDEALHGFDVPVTLHELRCQIIQ